MVLRGPQKMLTLNQSKVCINRKQSSKSLTHPLKLSAHSPMIGGSKLGLPRNMKCGIGKMRNLKVSSWTLSSWTSTGLRSRQPFSRITLINMTKSSRMGMSTSFREGRLSSRIKDTPLLRMISASSLRDQQRSWRSQMMALLTPGPSTLSLSKIFSNTKSMNWGVKSSI